MSTLLRSAFGDFDYNSVVNANRVLGPVFFFMWLLYAAVILLNMAIAIISESFVKVRHRAAVRVRCGFAVAVCSSDVLCFGQFSKSILFLRHAYLVLDLTCCVADSRARRRDCRGDNHIRLHERSKACASKVDQFDR